MFLSITWRPRSLNVPNAALTTTVDRAAALPGALGEAFAAMARSTRGLRGFGLANVSGKFKNEMRK